jgi:GPH family glycoside/pentoside/hexuronide:cation symporter
MSDLTEIKREPTTTIRKINFSAPRIGSSIVLGIEGTALFALYYLGYGVPSILVGFALSMGYLSIAASQFIFGWISDVKYTKWGRRKPYVFVLAPMLGISFIFLMLPPLFLNMNDKTAVFIWLLIWDIVFRVSYAVTTPYQAWMAELFPSGERPKVSQYQNTMNYIGNTIMLLFTLLFLTPAFGSIAVAVPSLVLYPIIIFGIIVIILYLISVFTIPTEPNFKMESSLFKNLITIIKNKNYMKVVVMQGIASFAWSIITSVMLTFVSEVLGFGTGINYYIIAVVLVLGIFTFLYLWRKVIQKKGKRNSLLYLFLFAAILLPVSLVGLIPFASNIVFGIIFILIIAATLGGWYLFPYIYYADLAEDDEKKTGELKAGIYVGFPSILLNIFQAFGPLIIGAILGLQDITVGTLTYSLGLVLWGPICSVILLITYIYTRGWEGVQLDFEWERKNKE